MAPRAAQRGSTGRLTGDVELELDGGATKVSADEVEIFTDANLLRRQGQRHAHDADAADFGRLARVQLKTKLGTFRHASGNARIHPDPAQTPAVPGAPAAAPTAENAQYGTQEPDILFYGETIEKIGERKYRITNGGFTTCVQPKPRWEITSGTVVLNIDHYAMLRNSVMRVKGVPLLYLPVIYYPINKEDRATGFLLPMYGSSTPARPDDQQRVLLGDQPQPGRHDHATTGSRRRARACGGEYRYVALAAPRMGDVPDATTLKEQADERWMPAGNTSEVPGRTSFELPGQRARRICPGGCAPAAASTTSRT